MMVDQFILFSTAIIENDRGKFCFSNEAIRIYTIKIIGSCLRGKLKKENHQDMQF